MAMPLPTSFFNWQTCLNDSDMSSYYCSFFHEETPPPPPLLPDYSDHESFFFLNNINNNPNSTMMLDYCSSFPELTYPSTKYQTPSSLPLSHDHTNSNIFPISDDDDLTFQYPYPNKRRKLSFEDINYQLPYYHNDNYYCYGGFGDNDPHYSSSSLIMPEFDDVIGVPLPPPPLQLPVAAQGSDYVEKKWCGGEVKEVSAQSVAARERRKKIAEKTEELGKMVPGGCKMNTAEMLLAASKYVKYLQAQVSMLQLMNNNTFNMDDKTSTFSDNQDQQLQAMLSSPSVEEKLYMQEKCLVPQHLVTNLTNRTDIQTKSSILKDLNQLITVPDTEKKQLH